MFDFKEQGRVNRVIFIQQNAESGRVGKIAGI